MHALHILCIILQPAIFVNNFYIFTNSHMAISFRMQAESHRKQNLFLYMPDNDDIPALTDRNPMDHPHSNTLFAFAVCCYPG